MDGNRRWARQAGMANPSLGHRAGAEHAEQVLSWCGAVIKNITVFICSTENLQHRDDAEVAYLMQVIEEVVLARLAHREARRRRATALPGRTSRSPSATAGGRRSLTRCETCLPRLTPLGYRWPT
jgi:short-chain Z-isoprenyl diphosphate synthase